MATRRAAVEEQVEEVTATPVQSGLGASDMALPRMRVVGKDADLVGLGVAKPLDIAIGASSDDEDSTVYDGTEGLRFCILDVRFNYACGFNGPKGVWEEGDPEMPAEAKKQYHYTLCIPEHDDFLPVLYTANGSAAKELRKANTAYMQGLAQGKHPTDIVFSLTTKMASATINGQTKTWPAPVIKRAQFSDDEKATASAMYDAVMGGRKQIESGDVADSDGPDY